MRTELTAAASGHSTSASEQLTTRPIESFSCHSQTCSAFGQPGGMRLYTRYGQKRLRLLVCKTCGTTRSELSGTIFFDSRLPAETIVAIYRKLLEGSSIRGAGRNAVPGRQISKNTVKRYLRAGLAKPEQVAAFLREFGGPVLDSASLWELLLAVAPGWRAEKTEEAVRV